MAMKSVGSPAAWSGNNAFHHPQQQQPRWLCGALRRLRGSVIGVVAARGVCNSHREASAASTRYSYLPLGLCCSWTTWVSRCQVVQPADGGGHAHHLDLC